MCRRATPIERDRVKYQRNDGDWNAERLLPELNEIRIATSTGTNDHRT